MNRQPLRAWPFYRDDLNVDAYNPNEPQLVRRYVRVVPLAGAAIYPVVCNIDGGELEYWYGPDFHDLGGRARIALAPRKFGDAFSPSGLVAARDGSAQTPAPTPIGTPPPALPGWTVPDSVPNGLSGFISGDYVVESTDDLGEAMRAQSSPAPSMPWLAAYRYPLTLTNAIFITLTAPWLVPDYKPGQIDPTFFDGHLDGFFLGCGSRVVRYSFFDLSAGGDSPFPVTFRKYILGPFSQTPEPAGVITVDTADSMVQEDTIDIDTPLWMYLVRDDGGAGAYGVTIQVSRQPHS